MIELNQEIHIEEDFWNDFILEAFEHIEEIETNVISLEQNPDDMEIIHTMFRAYHTIKGLSGFVEHTVIQEVAHKTETLMDYCRKGELKVNTKIVDAILKSSDYIKRLCEEVESYKDNSFIQKINDLIVVLEELANVDDAQVSAAKDVTASIQPEVPQEVKEEPVAETPVVEEPVLESVPEEKVQDEDQSQEDFFAEYKRKFGMADDSKEEKVKEEPAKAELSDKEKDLAAFLSETAPEILVIPEEEEPDKTIEAVEEPVQEPTPELIKEPVAAPTLAPEPEPVLVGASVKAETFEKASFEPAQQIKAEVNLNDNSPKKFAANEEYMKVANSKIDHLVEMIGELIINQSLLEQHIEHNYSNDNQLITDMSGFFRTTRELQNLSMSLRMVSLKQTFQKISRIARDTIQELNKNVEFVTSGDNTEIDRVVTDKLLDPLVHLIKNAISHGVEESEQDRIKQGKNPRARVELNAYNKRGKIFIEVKDDGRGINTEIVYKKALEKGLIDPNHVYSEEEIKEFILLPGFSTAAVVDNISGRGVGMDVVKTQILKIGGKVNIESTLGKGSVFTLEVPVNHAIMNGTIIEMHGQHFIVPTINVKEILQPADSQWIFTQQKRTMLRVRENIISIVPISLFFKGVKQEDHVPLVMLLELDGELRALPITNVVNRQEVVVKPVGEEFSNLKYISGMSILGTGKVSLILDIDYLFKKEVKE